MAYILIIASNAHDIAKHLTDFGHEVEACITGRDAYNKQLDINLAEERGVDLYIIADIIQRGGGTRCEDADKTWFATDMLALMRHISWWHNVYNFPPAPVITATSVEGQPDVYVVNDFTIENIFKEVQTLLP